ncbi:type I restriction-modification system DNA methylase [Streptococcus mutans SA38]|uniref:type I restriction-modification system subunit M n=1 Tax=Streptococcus mutans TaxID=1309 RepID=UPI0002B576D9|nr:type I restriction-modification system subunit M [Streptococcus mutans]EMC47314.1 type I restriction-modification system DNA methylase [Streptococcus mutans SA38]
MSFNKESQQRQELHQKIWAIADNVRGAVDGWDFKQYILGILFYRFISENMSDYFDRAEHEAGDPDFRYADLSDEEAEEDFKPDTVEEKGFFILPSQLFENIVKTASTNENLNTDLAKIFKKIEESAIGKDSEHAIKGLFDDVDTTSNRLGGSVKEKNKRLSDILTGIAELDFGTFEENDIDAFGDAYEYLISNYASNAGKSGGEFFTPQTVSKLLAQLVMVGKEHINKVYDPTCGSGSLLLQMKKQFETHILEEGFFGQEINMTNYNLARMNMFLHNINYNNFDIRRGDTLLNPQHLYERPFDAIVSNPPYSIKWIGDADPTLINDERFAPAGKLAPKSKADFAFIMHSLSHLSNKGRAAIVCFPGIFYRGGAEKTIRQYLIDNNFVEAVIALPDNLFYGTSIATYILVLAKNKSEDKTLFIDASSDEKSTVSGKNKFYETVTNGKILNSKNIEAIVELFKNKKDVGYEAKLVDNNLIAEENDYNLSVSTYVEKRDTREIINIDELNKEIAETVKKIDHLRSEIDKIVEELSHD